MIWNRNDNKEDWFTYLVIVDLFDACMDILALLWSAQDVNVLYVWTGAQ